MSSNGVNGGDSFSNWCDSIFGSPSPTEGPNVEQIVQIILDSPDTETGRAADNLIPSWLSFTPSPQEGLSADLRGLVDANPIERISDNTGITGMRRASEVFAASLPPKRPAVCQSNLLMPAKRFSRGNYPNASPEEVYDEGRKLIKLQDLEALEIFLTNHGSDHSNYSKSSCSLLHCCVSCLWEDGVKLLLEHGAPVVFNDVRVAIGRATKKLKILPMLLEKCSKELLDSQEKNGETLLHVAVKRGNRATVDQVLVAKVNPNLQLKK